MLRYLAILLLLTFVAPCLGQFELGKTYYKKVGDKTYIFKLVEVRQPGKVAKAPQANAVQPQKTTQAPKAWVNPREASKIAPAQPPIQMRPTQPVQPVYPVVVPGNNYYRFPPVNNRQFPTRPSAPT